MYASQEGLYIHKLLELLPTTPVIQQDILAQQQARALNIQNYQDLYTVARTLYQTPSLQDLFMSPSYIEIPLSGTLFGQRFNGQIDRLLLTPTSLTIVDFKTTLHIPEIPYDIIPSTLTQMTIYWALLAQAYPKHTIQVEIIWVRKALRMVLPLDILKTHLTVVEQKIRSLS